MARCLRTLAIMMVVATSQGVRAQEAMEGDLECVIMPYSVLDLSSGVSGRLRRVAVDRADIVHAGQVLAELETDVERANRDLAAARAAMRSEVSLREASLEFDRRRHQRVAALHAGSAVSDQDREQAERDATLTRWQVELARDNLHLAGLELRRAEALLDLRTVSSPFDGVVLERFKSPGEYVDEEPVLRVARLDPLRIEVIAPIELHPVLRSARGAEVFSELDPDTAHRARVVAVDPVGDPASGTFRARLELPNPGNRLLAGVRCRARLLAHEASLDEASAAVTLHESLANQAPPQPLESLTAIPADSTRRDAPGPEVVWRAPTPSVAGVDPQQVVEPPQCRSIGPIQRRDDAARLIRDLASAGFTPRLREGAGQKTIGYIVLAIPESGHETPRALSTRLRQEGIADLAVLPRGRNAGRVSLGVYRSLRRSRLRLAQLADAGIPAEIIPRTRTSSGWWLDVELLDPERSDALDARFRELAVTSLVRRTGCGRLHTASR